ncbi:MAG TPA: PAS domain-containing protein, partial [Aggregatilineaceae bacterium]|nr:PAS domain-containing protein [Aggregatilineaceae bacterium]
MQVGTPSLNIDEIRSFWQSYTDTRRLDAQIDPMIAASWQRCSPRLNPLQFPRWSVLNHDVFALTLRQNGALYNIARPIMEDMYQYCEGAGMALTLSDSTNCILEMLGDPDLVAEGFRLGLRPGSFVDEGRFGTNAFAVALLEGCPVSVFGPEHFLRALHGLSTAAAPIFALEGYPVGTVGIVTPAASYTTLAHGMMIAAARAIENQIQAELLIQNANTQASELNATLQTISDGVLVWSGDGNITHLNQKAGELLRLAPSQVVGRPLTEHIILPEGLARAVILRQELHDVETSLNVNDMAHGCLVSLQIVRDQDDTPLTYIATLRPIEQVRQLVNRLVGAQAHHTLDEMIGQSAAVRRVRRQALMAANAKVTVLLQGESGT